MVMSRHHFRLLSFSSGRDLSTKLQLISFFSTLFQVATSFLLIDFLNGCKLSSLASAFISLQVATSFDTVFGCTLNTVIFMLRHQVDVAT